jgi:HNH endonuclease
MNSGNHHVPKLAERQGWLCIWCEFPMARDFNHAFEMAKAEQPPTTSRFAANDRRQFGKWVQASFDHIIPRAEGGTEAITNGLAACKWCNNFRGTEDPKLFKERITALVHRGLHPRQLFRQDGRWPSGMPLKRAVGHGGIWRREPVV